MLSIPCLLSDKHWFVCDIMSRMFTLSSRLRVSLTVELSVNVLVVEVCTRQSLLRPFQKLVFRERFMACRVSSKRISFQLSRGLTLICIYRLGVGTLIICVKGCAKALGGKNI